MKKIYETKVTSIGGREGEVFSPDRSFAFKTKTQPTQNNYSQRHTVRALMVH